MKTRYKATISYNGTNYHGWAKQPNSVTIQDEVEKAIFRVFNQKTKVIAAGRTDAGVHALGQVVHFDLNLDIKTKQILSALNKVLPYDIRFIKIQKTNKNFNARFDAKSKTYVYYINIDSRYNAVDSNHIYQYNKPIKIAVLKKASKFFLGKHNFLSFSTDQRNGQSLIREVTSISIKQNKKIVKITVKGNSFLRSQIRMMVGALLALNINNINIDRIISCLKNPQKGQIMYKAPACGLVLYKIIY